MEYKIRKFQNPSSTLQYFTDLNAEAQRKYNSPEERTRRAFNTPSKSQEEHNTPGLRTDRNGVVSVDYENQGDYVPTTAYKIGTDIQDIGTRMIHGVQTFGSSLVGDAVKAFSPKTADWLEQNTFGLITTTPEEKLQRNRSGKNRWRYRLEDAANAITTVIGFSALGGVGKAAMGTKTGQALLGSKVGQTVTRQGTRFVPKNTNFLVNQDGFNMPRIGKIADPAQPSPLMDRIGMAELEAKRRLSRGKRKIQGAVERVKRPVRDYKDYKKGKSELNWGQWNSEIDPKMIKQYNKIERQTKRKGTWMKNADGTDFDMMQSRMPKEVSSQMKDNLGFSARDLDEHIFVQSKTKEWKKAFGKDPDIFFRGQNTYNPRLDQSNIGLGRSEKDKSFINFFTNKYNQGEYYGMGGGAGTNVNSFFVEQNKRVLPFHPDNTSKYALAYDDVLRKSWEGGIPGGVHTVGIPKKINTRVLEGNNERWFNINAPDIERFIDKSVANKKAIWRIDPSKRDHAYNFKQLQNGNSWIIAKPNHIATDDVASYMNLRGVDNIRINNILDGSTWDSVRKGFLEGNMMPPEVSADIYLSKPKSSIKSLLFNNGKFDLKNSNIYKTLLPAVIGSSIYSNRNKESR